MGNIILWAIIAIAVIIIIIKVVYFLTGKSDSCSSCSYKSDCKKHSGNNQD